jgi:hypothetical protein
VDKTRPTQVGRALAQLGIRHIPAYSPQARGRMERAFGTLQGRLPQALRLAGITTVAAANVYLREVYVPGHNARFGKPACTAPGVLYTRLHYAARLKVVSRRAARASSGLRYPFFPTSHSAL